MKMASEDVIELGSSEDEAEPAPKKKKPAPNAMVQFPNKSLGLKVISKKALLPPLQKVLAGGSITITKTGKPPQLGNKPKQNIRPLQKNPVKILQRVQKVPGLPIIRPVIKPIMLQNLSINPLNVMKIHQASNVTLPPGITVKRTAASKKMSAGVSITRKKISIRSKPDEKMVTTVDDDDEVVPVTSEASPQWYLRPEEQTTQPATKEEEMPKDNALVTQNSMEAENNKEPDKTKYIEITIEDSPIKPMRMVDVGTDLAITIEDSPVKAASTKLCTSDSDSDSEMPTVTTPHSKKKLEYKHNEQDSAQNETITYVEIDLERVEETEHYKTNDINQHRLEKGIENKQTPEESAVKRIKPVLITKEVNKTNESMDESKSDNSEFHPVYQSFIDLCFKLENSDDMKKIVEKKIKTYYRQCPKEYVESEEFIDMVSSKIFAMKAGPDKMYLYIKDVVDELNLQRKSAKAIEQASNKENKKTENDEYFRNDDTERDSKKARQIRKLEKTIKKIHRAIQKLEEQEVEFEDEEDSVYLLTERYKERLVRVYAKFCQLSNTKMPSEPRIQIEARPGQPTGPAKRLEKWVNKKVPIGTPLPFPDFHDVLRCVREANEEDRLGWNEADIMEEARDLFTRCGKKLQRRRQENEWRIAASRITYDTSTADPAENSDDLRKKLEENRTVAAKKEIELLNKYADKQNQLKLVAEEIGDKEAEESPVESEDEEVNDNGNSLGNKQKRKERLKRLLHEKTRKMSVEKENISTNEVQDNEEKIDDTSKEQTKEEKNVTSELEENKQQAKEKEKESNTNPSIEENNANNNNLEEERQIDDTFDVDSDIDELHLLQKLYSENEMNSSCESGSDSPIAISDSLDSESEFEKTKKQQNYDVISIENSSYSESEVSKEECSKEYELKSMKDKKVEERDCTTFFQQENEMMIECDENILLASSEEENDNTESQLQIENISGSKNAFETKKINNDPIDEVILDDGDENIKQNNKITKKVENLDSTKINTENIAADVNKTANLRAKNDFDKEIKMNAVSIEINEAIIDSSDSTSNTNEKHINEDNFIVADECSTQNSEGSCEIISISETGNQDNIVENEINSQTNLNDCELHNNIPSSEVVSNSNKDNIESNVSLQLTGILDENLKFPSNSVKIPQNKNKPNECDTSEDLKMDISEHLESSESLKDLQTNASENVQV